MEEIHYFLWGHIHDPSTTQAINEESTDEKNAAT